MFAVLLLGTMAEIGFRVINNPGAPTGVNMDGIVEESLARRVQDARGVTAVSAFDAWGAAQWPAVISTLAAIVTVWASRSAAKAPRAAERSVEAHLRPQIALMFMRREDTILLRILNAGRPAQHIVVDADPPPVNSRGQVLTEHRDLRHGHPVLLPLESMEFPFDTVWAYFGVQHLVHRRPLEFEIVIRGWAANPGSQRS